MTAPEPDGSHRTPHIPTSASSASPITKSTTNDNQPRPPWHGHADHTGRDHGPSRQGSLRRSPRRPRRSAPHARRRSCPVSAARASCSTPGSPAASTKPDHCSWAWPGSPLWPSPSPSPIDTQSNRSAGRGSPRHQFQPVTPHSSARPRLGAYHHQGEPGPKTTAVAPVKQQRRSDDSPDMWFRTTAWIENTSGTAQLETSARIARAVADLLTGMLTLDPDLHPAALAQSRADGSLHCQRAKEPRRARTNASPAPVFPRRA